MSWKRVIALMYRHIILFRHNLGRMLDTFYWPLIDIVSWGFLTVYFSKTQVGNNLLIQSLLSAVILWTLVYTFARDIAITFLDEMWDRNIMNLYCSPLRPEETLLAAFLFALIRVILSVTMLTLIAKFFYSFNIFQLGFYFGFAFIILVVFSYGIGVLAMTLVLRFGPSVEIFAWSVPAILAPISGVFYPVSVLPPVLQNISRLLPTTYIFEGMRAVITGGQLNWNGLIIAGLLDVIYVSILIAIFLYVFHFVQKNGLIARFT